MVLALALVEGSSLFVILCLMLLWRQPSPFHWSSLADVVGPALALSICCWISFYYNDLYQLRVVRSLREFVPRLFQSLAAALILVAVVYVFLPPQVALIGSVVLSDLMVIAGVLLLLRSASYALMEKGLLYERVLILGTGTLAQQVVTEIEDARHLGYSVLGFVDDRNSGGMESVTSVSGFSYPVWGSLSQVEEITEKLKPDRIVVVLNERRGRLPVWKLLQCSMNGVYVEDGVETYERITGKLAVESLAPSNIIFCNDFRKSRLQLAAVRIVNVLGSSIGIIFLVPLLVLVALAIKLDSPGPVFFIHRRLGRRNRSFNLIKFRTMHPRQGETTEWVADNKSRITRVGAWLRKYRVDELPQLFNVFWGSMNLIGPRPHPVTNHELFTENISYYPLRSLVRPGITGWAQVRYGYANNLEQEKEKMRYDLYYIKHMSIWLDVRIVLDTVKFVMFGKDSVLRSTRQGQPKSHSQTVTQQPGVAALWRTRAS